MRKLFILLISLTTTLLISAQEAKTVFMNMPDSLTVLLTAVNKADFIDFLESDMKAKVKNKLDGESEMTDLTSSYIRIRMTDRSNWQMKLLPVSSGEKVVCAVSTACAPVCESIIRFYTTDWEELPLSNYLTFPVEDDFYQDPEQDKLYEYTQLRKKADMFLVQAELDKEADLLSFKYTTPEYLDKEDGEELVSYIRPVLSFEWRNDRFMP